MRFFLPFFGVDILMIALALPLSAQPTGTIEEIPLRAGATVDAVEEVTFRHRNLDDRGFNRTVTRVAVPTLTVYRPSVPAHRRAAVLICPGGGYQDVVIDREGHALARYFQERGLVAVVLKYRLPDPSADPEGLPRPQQDALAALQLMRRNAVAWGLDPDRIGLLGCSAGGHLAGSAGILGADDSTTRAAFVALLYPVTLMEGPHVHAGSRERLLGATPSAARLQAFSLERLARPGLPPFFLVHARDDKAVPSANSEQFAAALRAAGSPVELMLVATGGHGFSLGRSGESARWPARFLAWLDRLP